MISTLRTLCYGPSVPEKSKQTNNVLETSRPLSENPTIDMDFDVVVVEEKWGGGIQMTCALFTYPGNQLFSVVGLPLNLMLAAL